MTKIQSQSNSIPLYLQVKNKIKQEIRSGILKAGDKLDSEAEMQKEYGMSRVTVRNAMAELERRIYYQGARKRKLCCTVRYVKTACWSNQFYWRCKDARGRFKIQDFKSWLGTGKNGNG